MDRNGMTPLMWASYRSFGIDPLRLILNFGASVNYCDSNYKNTGVQNFYLYDSKFLNLSLKLVSQ